MSTPEDATQRTRPETYYVDDEGRVVAHSLGGLSREELEGRIAAIKEGTG